MKKRHIVLVIVFILIIIGVLIISHNLKKENSIMVYVDHDLGFFEHIKGPRSIIEVTLPIDNELKACKLLIQVIMDPLYKCPLEGIEDKEDYWLIDSYLDCEDVEFPCGGNVKAKIEKSTGNTEILDLSLIS